MNGNINASCTSSSSSSSVVYGSGIGTGYASSSVNATIGNLTIMNGNINASCTSSSSSSSSSAYGSGIGTGYAYNYGHATIQNLTIMNGTIIATCAGSSSSVSGSGIGTGYTESPGNAAIGNITISGGHISTLNSVYGIGSGEGTGEVVYLRLSGRAIVHSSSLVASSIVLSDGPLVFITDDAPLFQGPLSSSGKVELAILYASVTGTEQGEFSNLNATLLQIRQVNDLTGGGWWWRLESPGAERWFYDESIAVQRLVVTVPGEGLSSIFAERGGEIGVLGVSEDQLFFQVNSTGLEVAVATLYLVQSRSPLQSCVWVPTATESAFFTCPVQGCFEKRRVTFIFNVGPFLFLMWDIFPG
jgi:hypothetical protein